MYFFSLIIISGVARTFNLTETAYGQSFLRDPVVFNISRPANEQSRPQLKSRELYMANLNRDYKIENSLMK